MKHRMKRTPLNRYTPLNRGNSQLKRTRIKQMSDKRKALLYGDGELAKLRREWLKGKWCYVCRKRRACSVHELIGGSEFRHHTERDPLFWAAVCEGPSGCHGRVQSNFVEWPLARMIAHKLVAEGGEFDLLRFNQIVGRRHAVEMEQIDYWLNEMEVRQ